MSNAGCWYISTDEEQFNIGPYDSREEAIAEAAADIDGEPGATFWVGQAYSASSRVTAEDFLEMLDQHSIDEGPDGCDGYQVSQGAKAELDAFLCAWVEKHDVRPPWFDIHNVSEHRLPESVPTTAVYP